MLYLNKTRVMGSKHAPVAASETVEDEGQALVTVDEGGQLAVRPSTGAAGEKFYGFAMFERQMPKTLAKVVRIMGTGEEQVIPLTNLVTGSGRATVDGNAAGAAVTWAAGAVTITDAVDEGQVVELTYTYNATVIEAQRLVGHTWDRTALTAGAQVGCGQVGEFYISNFITSVAWAVGDTLNMAANGMVTKGGAGALIPDAIVIAAPQSGAPYLGIELR